MIHFALPAERCRPAPSAPSPFTPASYLRLRRKAAGISVDMVARSISANNQAEAKALVLLLETDESKARYRETIEALTDAFPLDVDVYMQLRDTPPEQHPRICRGCGCSKGDPCVSGDGTHRCRLHDQHICTRCVETPVVPVHQ